MKKIIQLLTLAIILLFGAISCTKDSFNINKNPNDATDSTIVYNVILPSALNNTGRVVTRNWGWLQNYLGYWARSGTYAPNTAEETYDLTTSFQAQIWTNLYDNLYDYQVMGASAKKAGADYYEGIARIMKAHNYALLVDIYNNLPYNDALKGAGNITPKYDKGIDIYKDLLRQIDTGIALITNANLDDPANKDIETNDIMLGGDQNLWAQFGNTLKLRLLTHLMNGGVTTNSDGSIGSAASYAAGIDIPAEIAIIDAQGNGYLTADAAVQPAYSASKPNPFYELYVADNTGTATANSVYYDANTFAIGYYSYNGDDRIGGYYTTVGGIFRGVQYGLPSETSNADATLSGIGTGVSGNNATTPVRIITAAESYFLQAEAINRGLMTGDAATALNQGIYASFESIFVYAGSTAANGDLSADDYLAFNAGYSDVDYNAVEDANNLADGGLYTIISQKWFALNALAPYEVWSDYRRVDFSATTNHFVYGTVTSYVPLAYPTPGPAISVSPANSKTEIPVRLLYPQSEYLYNATNVGAEPAIGAYPFSHIFWDAN